MLIADAGESNPARFVPATITGLDIHFCAAYPHGREALKDVSLKTNYIYGKNIILHPGSNRDPARLRCSDLLSYAAGSPVLPDVLADSCCFDTHKKSTLQKN